MHAWTFGLFVQPAHDSDPPVSPVTPPPMTWGSQKVWNHSKEHPTRSCLHFNSESDAHLGNCVTANNTDDGDEKSERSEEANVERAASKLRPRLENATAGALGRVHP